MNEQWMEKQHIEVGVPPKTFKWVPHLKKDPLRWVKDIGIKQLEKQHAAAKLKFYHTLKGSTEFHVIVFYPKETTVRSTKHLQRCDSYRQVYGSSYFSKIIIWLNKNEIRSIFDQIIITKILMMILKAIKKPKSLMIFYCLGLYVQLLLMTDQQILFDLCK